MSESSIAVKDLNFSYGPKPVLRDVSFQLKKGDRCLLVGENGAGKSTLLRLLGGKNMTPKECIQMLGGHPFFDTSLNARVSYLGGAWARDVAFVGYGVSYQGDFPVSQMLQGLNIPDQARLQHLIHVLDVDLTWRMHQVSDGQRRRVQLLLGLLQPFDVLLLDEITTDLDVVARQDLLQFLFEESELRGVTIIYATHIFDGMQAWATKLAHMANGRMVKFGDCQEMIEAFQKQVAAQDGHQVASGGAGGSVGASWLRASWTNPLVRLVSEWIREHKVPKANGAA